MAYAAVTSLMETLSLHFLQSQSRFPLEDLEAQIRDGNENLGLLQKILKKSEIANYYPKKKKLIKSERPQLFEEDLEAARMSPGSEYIKMKLEIIEAWSRETEVDDEASSKGWTKLLLRIKACLHRLYGKQKFAWDSILLTSRLREMTEVKQKIVSLHQNLGLLQQSLEKSDIIACNDARVRVMMKDLEAQIRDASFKAEERIEMELTSTYLAKDTLHVTASLLRLHQIFNEAEKQTDYHRNELISIQTENQQLAKTASSKNQRLTDVSLLGRIRQRGLQLVKGSSLHHLVHKKIIVRNFSKNTSKFDDRMVGCEKLFEKILDQLITQQTTKGRQVVSIVGMGGIGKTTLAHRVYEHPSITSHFDKRAWVTVSQEYNIEQMLQCLLSCVTAASRDRQDQLAESVYKSLKSQRYLIVIDDIWNTTAWDSVQRCFPNDNNGSCILLTSRLREVAEYASSGNSPLDMPFLDADESWNLYCKVFGKTEFLLVFEQIGRDIVKKCDGLPLAITIVASLLSKIEEEEEKWKNVAKSVMGDSSDACSRILYLSYNHLPQHLKACFLYFGIFEEDYEISVKKLVRLWAAEGFLSTVKQVNLEEMAMECLKDLVDRSLVIVSKHSYNGEIKKIMIHDLLRDLCLREARIENLLNVNGVKKKTCRWISHTSRSFHNKVRFEEDECFHKSHSFHLFYVYYSWDGNVKRLFSHMNLLRVLDMRNRIWEGVVDLNVLGSLVHLRYLALSTYKCSKIKLFEHWNMQSLIVSGDGAILHSSEPSRIWKMPQLRNFFIERICSLETPSVVYKNLENICWLDSKLCTKDLFTMIPNLKTLGVDGRCNDNSLDCFKNFVHLEQLEKLSIRWWMNLNLVKCSIPWATSLPNLKKLSLLKCNMQWSELSAISMLPNLEVLKLIDACKGPKWETSDGGFRRLKRLVIKEANFQCWNAVGDHFPMLECLEISECFFLEEIPRGFVDITTLALIRLRDCGASLVTSAEWIQEEQNNYGNDVLLVPFYY